MFGLNLVLTKIYSFFYCICFKFHEINIFNQKKYNDLQRHITCRYVCGVMLPVEVECTDFFCVCVFCFVDHLGRMCFGATH